MDTPLWRKDEDSRARLCNSLAFTKAHLRLPALAAPMASSHNHMVQSWLLAEGTATSGRGQAQITAPLGRGHAHVDSSSSTRHHANDVMPLQSAVHHASSREGRSAGYGIDMACSTGYGMLNRIWHHACAHADGAACSVRVQLQSVGLTCPLHEVKDDLAALVRLHQMTPRCMNWHEVAPPGGCIASCMNSVPARRAEHSSLLPNGICESEEESNKTSNSLALHAWTKRCRLQS